MSTEPKRHHWLNCKVYEQPSGECDCGGMFRADDPALVQMKRKADGMKKLGRMMKRTNDGVWLLNFGDGTVGVSLGRSFSEVNKAFKRCAPDLLTAIEAIPEEG